MVVFLVEFLITFLGGTQEATNYREARMQCGRKIYKAPLGSPVGIQVEVNLVLLMLCCLQHEPKFKSGRTQKL